MKAVLHGLLLVAASSAVPVAVRAAPAPAPSAESGQLSALLDLVVPGEAIVAANVAEWRTVLAERFDDDAALVAREKAKPGLRAEAIGAGLAEVERSYRTGLARVRVQARSIYAESLTAQEISDLVTFFRTPTGGKLVMAMHNGIATSRQSTPDGMRTDGQRAVLSSLNESDRPALEAFAKTSVMQKSRTVSPRIAEISNREIMAITEDLSAAIPAAWNRVVGAPLKTESAG